MSIISYRANILKNNASPEDYAKVYNFYMKLEAKNNLNQAKQMLATS
jgi:hypothetical protein